MQQQITISGYHWPDIFDLPCVESIHKSYIKNIIAKINNDAL